MKLEDKAKQLFENYGFTSKESQVYIALIELDTALPSTLAKKTGLKRSTTYVILEQLKKRGMVGHFKKNNSTYFKLVDPKQFLNEQKGKLETLSEIMPDLLKLHERFGVTPQMSVFEGREGIIQIMEDTLDAKEPLHCWADITLASNTILEDYYPSYIKKKNKNKVFVKGIFCYDPIALDFKKKGKEELREVYLIPKEKFPFKNEINIYDDKVAIISHQDLVGVIIQNKAIADTQKAIFNLGFEYAKIIEKDLLTKKDKQYLKEKIEF